ncbi:MAG: endonuclease/exonuclease/phosphatase family protein [Bacteroidales bacterium]|jgi:endonuclease/exonuclease/phosphatase family metal-dependent hydrolase|nr:endonuclease/exonuclease/phosphatase family protein [Bacteroidales bacterium]
MKKFFRLVFLILNIMAATGLLLSYLSCRISPEKIWWLGFFGLAYLYLFIFNLIFIVIWAFSKKKKYLLISLLVILPGWGVTGRNIQLWGKKLPETLHDNKIINVLSCNVHMFLQKNGKQENGKPLHIIDFFVESQPDILCMQEFTTDLQKEISRRTDMPYLHVELSNRTGIATYSRFPIVERKRIYSDRSINVCMYTDVAVGDDTLRVFNIHLKSIGFNIKQWDLLENAIRKDYDTTIMTTVRDIVKRMATTAISRSAQAGIIRQHIDRSPYAVIICGDFNDPPVSYSYRKVRGNCKDAFVEAGRGISATYNIGQISRQRIDYILHSPVFDAYDYKCPRVSISDHYPVMCKLKINPTQPKSPQK